MIRVLWAIFLICLSPSAFGQPVAQEDSSPTAPLAATPGAKLPDERMGDLYEARKEYRAASEVYIRLVDQQPHNSRLLNKLAISLHQQMELDLALKYYQLATKADPLNTDALNNMGTVWYERKNYGKAIKNYRMALKVRKDLPITYCNLGYAYFGQKKYKESTEAFRRVLLLDPHYFEHHNSGIGTSVQDRSMTDPGRFYFMLAKSCAQTGDLERSFFYLRKSKDEGFNALAAAKADPAFAEVLNNPVVLEQLAPTPPDTTQP
ncbi:MAG: hypothetical protein NVS9B4_18870 [Candidatus Acidiferrum sp.]